MIAAIDSSGTPSWVAYAAAAMLGAVLIAGVVRSDGAVAAAADTETGWSAVQTELARSRRHDRRMTLVGIEEDVWSRPGVGPSDRVLAAIDAATAIQSHLRRPDRAWVDGSMLHILLTDCDHDQGLAYLERARESMPQLFPERGVRLAVFPDDGVTLGALLARLQSDGEIEAQVAVR